MRGRERRGLAYRFASFAGAAFVALATLVGTPNVTAHAGECVAPPTGSVSFLPTSQLTDGSTLVADDGASVAIGELPSLLPSLPGLSADGRDLLRHDTCGDQRTSWREDCDLLQEGTTRVQQ